MFKKENNSVQRGVWAKAKPKGFTIAEVLITTVISAMCAAMVVPFMADSQLIKLKSSADSVYNDLNYAKQQAILLHAPIKVIFNTTTDSYSITDNNGNVLTDPHTKALYNVSLEDVEIAVSLDSPTSANTLIFNPIGNIDTGGSITLSDSATSTSYTIQCSVIGTINVDEN